MLVLIQTFIFGLMYTVVYRWHRTPGCLYMVVYIWYYYMVYYAWSFKHGTYIRCDIDGLTNMLAYIWPCFSISGCIHGRLCMVLYVWSFIYGRLSLICISGMLYLLFKMSSFKSGASKCFSRWYFIQVMCMLSLIYGLCMVCYL